MEHGLNTERAKQNGNPANDVPRGKSVFNPYYNCKFSRLLDKVSEAALFFFLSPRRRGGRENRPPRLRQSRAPRLVAARDAVFPLPAGDSGSAQRQGEGERDAANRNGRTDFVGSTRPDRRVRVGYHIERRACRWWKRARSRAHRCFERCFPLTPALSLGERVDTGPAPEKCRHRHHSLSCGWGRDRSHPVCPAITADRRVRGTPALNPARSPREGVVAPEPRCVSSVAKQILNL